MLLNELQIKIAVVAPFPTEDRVQEGWMSRIAAVDRLLIDFPRLYIVFGDHHVAGVHDKLRQVTEKAWEICLNAKSSVHKSAMQQIVDQVQGVYVHTVHLAENIVEFLDSGKFVVDMHGIVPEEEIMLGRPECAPHFANVEQAVLTHARCVVVVTNAMTEHFAQKYPELRPRYLCLPIFETYASIPERTPVAEGSEFVRPSALYSGGTQVWQNIDAMANLVSKTSELVRFSFYSHDFGTIRSKLAGLGEKHDLFIGAALKQDLPSIYVGHDFGLVLRDESPVNRVSCPTKLSEYLFFGLIPVVRFPRLGDFEEFGYWYVTEEEFLQGMIPDATSREWMREQNRLSIFRLMQRFTSAAAQLPGILSGDIIPSRFAKTIQ
jgi:hypothetical protein